MANKAALT